jgi:hypothetical protein
MGDILCADWHEFPIYGDLEGEVEGYLLYYCSCTRRGQPHLRRD